MNIHSDTSKDNTSNAVSNILVQNAGFKSPVQMVDNRPESIVQKKLQSIKKNAYQSEAINASEIQNLSEGNIVQRALYHYEQAPFSAEEATAWNTLVGVAQGFGIEADYITTIEDDAYSPQPATALSAATAVLSAAIAAHIRTTKIATTTADNFNWGDFHPQLVLMAADYGVLTGPRSTGNHQDNTYTYVVNGDTHHIAEPTNAHGRADGNINTRRTQMRAAIVSYNAAIETAAAEYD